MKNDFHRVMLILLVFVLALIPVGCFDDLVDIPPEEKDKGPDITLGVTPLSGKVQQTSFDFSEVYGTGYQSARTTVSEDAQVNLIVTAFNPGGVHEIYVLITPEALHASKRVAATADNKGPKQLNILGHDGEGGPGNMPLHVDFSESGAAIVTFGATNFNGAETKARVLFEVGSVTR